ncbi:DMT family transporter [Sporosarcina sp. 179-K 3D1 HS]|uniref:DMT family transporter n=1 Tax=Sporosarcina sp. 179-K 3D1 HS TaxID=3232169 RepID=UPI0039A3C9DF
MRNLFTKSNLALLLLVFFWGASWSVYKMTLLHMPPVLFAGIRALLGGLLLGAFVFAKRSEIRWRENWKKYVISSLFNSILFFGLQTVGLVYLPGGLFSVLVYFQPVLLGLFAWLWLGEYLAPVKIVGLLFGFVGIIIVSIDGLLVHISVIGVMLGLLTALCWALGTVYVKKVSRDINAFWMVSLQSIVGGSVLLGVGSMTESWSAIEWTIPTWIGIGYGATFGIPISYVIYYTLVNAGEASKVGSFTFLVPIIAVFIGTVFFGEPLTYTLLVGLLLVGLSIYLNSAEFPYFIKSG